MDKRMNLTMLTDFYEITMANGYFETGMADNIAYFDMFFRRVPDGGGYAIMAGVEQVIEYLKNLKFKVIPQKTLGSIAKINEEVAAINDRREKLTCDIDGAVIKVDDLTRRERLGATAKFPRWAAAYKYPPEIKPTVVEDIVVQVGRTGVLTPKAVVRPVRLAGTTVTNATLHNQDFITERDIRIGDTVVVRKAGEIIPEITESVKSERDGTEQIFEMPTTCPSCGEPVFREEGEAAVRCTNASCPAQLSRGIEHFASKDAMDIDGLGPQIVEALIRADLIRDPADLYTLKAEQVADLERMGDKSAKNLIEAIERSKQAGLERLLFALGIRNIGAVAAAALAARFGTLEAAIDATMEDLCAIPDFGEITALCVVNYFSHEQNRALCRRLTEAGLVTKSTAAPTSDRYAGKTFVLTGTLPTMSRD